MSELADKTILSRSIMGLLPTRGTERSGSIRFGGREIGSLGRKEMRSVWGKEMAMIFQDPMTSLNPLMTVGDQIAEPLRIHLGMNKSTAEATARRLCRSAARYTACHEPEVDLIRLTQNEALQFLFDQLLKFPVKWSVPQVYHHWTPKGSLMAANALQHPAKYLLTIILH